MPEPTLSYVALISRDVPAASRLLGEVLDLPRTVCETEDGAVTVFAAGQSALAVFGPGDRFVDGQTRTGVHHIGLDYGGWVPPVATAGETRAGLGGGACQAAFARGNGGGADVPDGSIGYCPRRRVVD